MASHIDFGSRRIDFDTIFSNRKTLGLTITPDAKLIVKAPTGTPEEKITQVVLRKAPWIIKQQSFFLFFQRNMPERRYVSGETHLYLGRGYKLRVLNSKKNEVGFTGREILVHIKPSCTVKQVLNEWYRERAKMKFAEIAEPLIERFKKYNVEPASLFIQEMATRWGSCTSKGKIILNPSLIKAPKPCIEYVIIHELCHLVHRNHNGKFFHLQKIEMPDWERWKNKLESFLH